MSRPALNIHHLSAAERFELIEQLWESLRTRPGGFQMSPDEHEIIAARRTAHRHDSSSAIDWETVRSELIADQDADDRDSSSSSPED